MAGSFGGGGTAFGEDFGITFDGSGGATMSGAWGGDGGGKTKGGCVLTGISAGKAGGGGRIVGATTTGIGGGGGAG